MRRSLRPYATSKLCYVFPAEPGAIEGVSSSQKSDSVKALRILLGRPQMGPSVEDIDPVYRELLIDFGDSGYLTLYRYEQDVVTVLALQHQRKFDSERKLDC